MMDCPWLPGKAMQQNHHMKQNLNGAFAGTEQLRAELDAVREAGLWRECATLDSAAGPFITVSGRRYLHLCSNNYLDLAGHPEVVRAAQEAAEVWGAGAGSARLITGTSRDMAELEAELAEFKRAEAALVFSSGYLANLGLITALAGAGDWLVCDHLNHASLIDAARLSRAQIRTYPHNDVEAAARILRDAPSGARKLILTDGVFSMDGDVAPLAELNELALRHGAWLVIDDAHGTGVLGPQGRGASAAFGLAGDHVVQVVTLSKALGSQGGAVAASRQVIETLVNRARPFVFETALAPPSVAAARAALRIVLREAGRRERLRENIALMRRGFGEMGFTFSDAETPIFPLLVGGNAEVLELSQRFREAGHWITAIRPPTVEEGKSRLRVTVMSSHERADLEAFLSTAAQLLAGRAAEAAPANLA